MLSNILKLDISGHPSAWISWQAAAALYARDKVRWEAGDETMLLRGGFRAGDRSELVLNSIIATDERPRGALRRGPTLKELYRRDQVCLYCGGRFPMSQCSRDHLTPQSRGGASSWENMVLSCKECNERKADRTPAEAGLQLLAVPYTPCQAKLLLLQVSGRITGCQQAFLLAMAKKHRLQ